MRLKMDREKQEGQGAGDVLYQSISHLQCSAPPFGLQANKVLTER